MEDKYKTALVEWHPQFDNPDFIGWSVVAAYLIAAILCARAAITRRSSNTDGTQSVAMWWLLACGLLFLGVNKQLNLQTLLIVIGRRVAYAHGWLEQRRSIQFLFSGAIIMTGLLGLWFLRAGFRQFFGRHRWAFAGVAVLSVFVMIRAASINHVFERAGIPQDNAHDDKRWTWMLEIGGSACLAFAATKPASEMANSPAA